MSDNSNELNERLRRNPLIVMDGQNITGDAADTIEALNATATSIEIDPDDLDLRVLVSNFVEGRTDATFDWIDAGELLEELKAALQEKS